MDLRIGALDDDVYGLTNVAAVLGGPGGHIFVAQPQDHAVKVFDAAGRFVRQIGRRGSGPGEFQDVKAMGWLGDSLWVMDARNVRVTYFRPDGTVLKSERLPALSTPHGAVYPMALLTGGRVAASGILLASDMAAGSPRVAPLVFTGMTGEDPVLVRQMRAGQYAIGVRRGGDGPAAMVSNPRLGDKFGDVQLFRTAPDGRFAVIVTRDLAKEDAASTFTVEKIDPAGRQVWRRPIPYTPQRVPRAQRDSIRGVLRMMVERLPAELRTAAAAQEMPVPMYYPPVTDVAIGADGTIWLRGPEVGVRTVEWTVLMENGATARRIQLPARSRVAYTTADRILAVEQDEDGIPFVVRYRF